MEALTLILAAFAGILSAVSLCLAVVALNYRRIPPEVESLNAAMQACKLSVADVNDRLEQWIARDRVRASRARREDGAAEPALPVPPLSSVDHKMELRRRMRATQGS